jgi:hypothetical protein
LRHPLDRQLYSYLPQVSILGMYPPYVFLVELAHSKPLLSQTQGRLT